MYSVFSSKYLYPHQHLGGYSRLCTVKGEEMRDAQPGGDGVSEFSASPVTASAA